MQAPVYLCLLGNDPAPAYLGLKVVEREAGRVAKAVFYSFPAWNEEYGKKRQAFFRLLSEKGVLYEERPLEKGLEEAEAREVWVNLTGGAKYWAVRFLGHWRRPGARVFLVEGHRALEAPRALFLWPREEERSLEAEALTLEEYARLYLEPLGEAWERVSPPGAFPPGAQAARLPGREGGVFVVHRGLPYWYWVRPHLGGEAKDMSRKALSAFSGEAKRLGGQLCLPVVPYHKAHLRSRHPKERENVFARWRAWAREYGVFLVDPGRPLEEEVASLIKGKASKKALPLPQEGPFSWPWFPSRPFPSMRPTSTPAPGRSTSSPPPRWKAASAGRRPSSGARGCGCTGASFPGPGLCGRCGTSSPPWWRRPCAGATPCTPT